MNAKENKQKQTEKLAELLNQADELSPKSRAEFLAERGVRMVGRAEWVKDESYTGTSKELFNCSNCGNRKTIKAGKRYQLMYAHFCQFCGFEMIYKEEKEN